MKQIYSFIFLVCIFNVNLLASDNFNFDQFKLSGSGCPVGSYEIVRTPDKKNASILFSEFTAEVPQFSDSNDNNLYRRDRNRNLGNNSIAYKVCNIGVYAILPEGHKIEGVYVDVQLRGGVVAEPGTSGQVKSELISWQGPRGQKEQRKVRIGQREWNNTTQHLIDEDWIIDKQTFINMNRTLCARKGEKLVHVNFQNSILTKLNNNYSNIYAFIGLDTADFSNKMNINFKISKCQNGPSTRNRPSRSNDRRNVSTNNRNRGPSVSNGRSGRTCLRYVRSRRGVIRCLN